MMKILQLHLWIQNKRETWTEPEVIRFSKKFPEGKPSKGKRIVIEPESQSLPGLKIQLAKELEKWKAQIKYYYVVVVVEKSDGTPGYRTIIPKVVLS
jgi:hypothetical protein